MVWAVALSATKLIPRSLIPMIQTDGIRSLIGFGSLVGPLSHSVLYLCQVHSQHSPSSDFGENQLSRGLISLSLLTTTHPTTSQG